MDISEYYDCIDGEIHFNDLKASQFAKNVSNDQNPIHDHDNKNYCIPGDLIFSMCADVLGLGSETDLYLHHPIGKNSSILIKEAKDGFYLGRDQSGIKIFTYRKNGETTDICDTGNFLNCFARVTETLFEDAIHPQLKQKGLMINPSSPSVVLTSISIRKSENSKPVHKIKPDESVATGNVKRAKVTAKYTMNDLYDNSIGEARKTLFISGLREYCVASMSRYKKMLDLQRYG